MKKLIIILLSCVLLSGCSFLPKLTFNRTTSALPQQTERSKAKEVCRGKAQFDVNGKMTSCSRGYYDYSENYGQTERKFTIFEHIGNFFSNLRGWFGILIIVSIVLIFTGFGGVVMSFWTNAYSTSARGFKMFVKGIQNVKEYIRSNGNKYTDAEKVIYQQALSDFMDILSKNITDKNVLKKINTIRAELKGE